jgi:hypothetical protein
MPASKRRIAPIGTFWDPEPECYRSQVSLIGGKRYRERLRSTDGEPARTPAAAEEAMRRLCLRLADEGNLDRDAPVARYYLGELGPNVVPLPDAAPEGPELEIPAALIDEAASWRRTAVTANPAGARQLLQQAATHIFRVLQVLKTEAPENYVLSVQYAVDELNDIANILSIGADDAQLIFAEAKKATEARVMAAHGPAAARSAVVSTWRHRITAARDLCDKIFAPVSFLVPGLIPEGVTLLASRPKTGKSWLLLQIGAAIAHGTSPLVTAAEPVCGDVLYLSLEDGERRVQRRMTKHFGAHRDCWPGRLEIATSWRTLDEGGLQDLRQWCAGAPKPTLIMIDTLKKVRAQKRNGQTDYAADYEACEGLMQLVQVFPGLAIIVAHHDRKMDADDVFDTVSGTLGLTGGVDTIAVLKRGGLGITLHIQGRDLVDDVEKAIRFDRETCRWTILGEAVEVRRSTERNKVLAALQRGSADGMSVSALMEAAQCSRSATDSLLSRMCADGEIERTSRGRYSLPIKPAQEA